MGVFPPITVCVGVCVWTVGNTWASDFFLLLSFVLFPPFRDASHCHFNRFGSHWIHFLMAGFKCHYILLGRSPGGGDGNPLHSWRIPWTEEPGGLQSLGSQRVGHDRVTEQLRKPWFPKAHPQSVQQTFNCTPGFNHTTGKALWGQNFNQNLESSKIIGVTGPFLCERQWKCKMYIHLRMPICATQLLWDKEDPKWDVQRCLNLRWAMDR